MKAYSRYSNTLEHFIGLFSANTENKSGKDIQRSFERDEVADEYSDHIHSLYSFNKEGWNPWESLSSRILELAEERTMTGHFDLHQREVFSVLIQSAVQNCGLLKDSYSTIIQEYEAGFENTRCQKKKWLQEGHKSKEKDYDQLLNARIRITETAINRARVFLLHQGPVLGLASKNSEEFKWVIARHFLAGDFVRDMAGQNQQLTACFKHLHQGGKQAVHGFSALCGCIYQQAKASRRLGATRVKSLLKCDDKTAQLLAEVYAALPEAPLA